MMPLRWFLLLALVMTSILYVAVATAEQLDDVQLKCHYEATVAQSVQLVRHAPDMDGLSYRQFVDDTDAMFNRGGPVGDAITPAQVADKDAWLDGNQAIARDVFAIRRYVPPEQVFAGFYDVCLIRERSAPVWEGG